MIIFWSIIFWLTNSYMLVCTWMPGPYLDFHEYLSTWTITSFLFMVKFFFELSCSREDGFGVKIRHPKQFWGSDRIWNFITVFAFSRKYSVAGKSQKSRTKKLDFRWKFFLQKKELSRDPIRTQASADGTRKYSDNSALKLKVIDFKALQI